MDDGVEADGKQSEGHECAENEDTGKQSSTLEDQEVFLVSDHREPSKESQRDAYEVLIRKWPAKEDEVRPKVEQLGRVNSGYVV